MNPKLPVPDAPPPQPPFPEAGGSPPQEAPRPEILGIEEFARLDLRVARVLAAEAHPKADRLLKLRVDLGTGQRQLVAGIAEHYRPEDLVGRTIIVVANLKPARLRGELSEGMLLAASTDQVVALLTTDREMPPGTAIH